MPINAEEIVWDEPIDINAIDWDYTVDMFPPNTKIETSIISSGKKIKKMIPIEQAIQELEENKTYIAALTAFKESMV